MATSKFVRTRGYLRSAAYSIGWASFAGIGVSLLLMIDDARRIHWIGIAILLAATSFVVSLVVLATLAVLRLKAGWSVTTGFGKEMSAAIFCCLASYGALSALPAVRQRLVINQAMTVQFGPDYVRITGGTGRSLPESLARGMALDFRPNRVYLANPGGDVKAGQQAASILIAQGARVAVIDGNCASACAYMAAMFPYRYLAGSGRLGYHDIRAYGGRPADTDNDRENLIGRLKAQGLCADVVERMFVSKNLVYPPINQLLREKLISGCWNEAQKAPAYADG